MRNKILTIVALVLFCSVVLLPPIIHGYVYPNIGDDTAAHMNVLDQVGLFVIDDGSPIEQIRYAGLYIVGYPLDLISYVFNVSKDTLFLWFNFLALMGVGIILFVIFRDLIGLPAGLLALLIPIFTSYSILSLFYSGVIFEIINIGIILPLACYCTIKWLMSKKKRFVISAVCLFLLFAVFHTTGVYLPFIAITGFALYVIYKVVKKQPISRKHVLFTAGLVSCFSLVYIFINPIWENLFQTMAGASTGISGFTLLLTSLLRYMSYLLLVVLLVSIALLLSEYKNINDTEKLTVITFSVLALIMLPAMLFGWSPQPYRQGYDFAIFMSLVAVALVGIVIRLGKYRVATMLLVGLAVGGSVLHIADWVGGYNSALEKVDIRAIEYVNALSGDTYSASDNVDPWIYSRYVEKKYSPLGGEKLGEILIIRNLPMKSKVALVTEGDLTSNRVLLNEYSDCESGVEIQVYR